jgi:hypothetical protein
MLFRREGARERAALCYKVPRLHQLVLLVRSVLKLKPQGGSTAPSKKETEHM